MGRWLRLMECVRLRIKDVDFDRKRIQIIGKGDRWRSTVLPDPIVAELKGHIERVRSLHGQDLAEGFSEVYITAALSRKYKKDISRIKSPLDDLRL
jgi:integrase